MTETEIRLHSIAFMIADILAMICAVTSGNTWLTLATVAFSVLLDLQFNRVKDALLKALAVDTC